MAMQVQLQQRITESFNKNILFLFNLENAAFIGLIAAEMGIGNTQSYIDFAESQVNYALGDNEQSRSYVVGFGNNPPQRPHHRAR